MSSEVVMADVMTTPRARGIKWALCVLSAIVACGAHPKRKPPAESTAIVRPATVSDHLIALLPPGPQLVVEVDLARLRGNPVVGPLVVKLLGPEAPPSLERLAGFADADQVVFAAYGLGTSQAATVTLMTAKAELAGTTKIADKIYAVGPADWVSQVAARAAIDAQSPLVADKTLLELRDRAMPPNAPGSSIRVAAHLTFDARIALSRITGIENAPGELSAWGDVADDFAIIVDADSRDGDKKPAEMKKDVARMKGLVLAALDQLAHEPSVIALGLSSSLTDAKLVIRGTWVRAIVAIGPRHLQRVVERATAFLGTTPSAP